MDRIFEKFGKFCTSYVFEDFFVEGNWVILEDIANLKKKLFLRAGRTWDLLL